MQPSSLCTAAQLVLNENGRYRVVPLDSDTVQSIGSGPTNTIVLSSTGVFDAHCALVPSQTGHRMVTLQAKCELCVNGQATHEVALRPFDRLRIGSCEAFYLPAATDAMALADVLEPSSMGSTRRHTIMTPAGTLQDRLLWLLLMIQEVTPGMNIDPVLDLVFEELLRWTRSDTLFLVLRSARADGRTFELARVCDAPADLDRDRALEALAPLLEPLLAAGTSCTDACPVAGYATAHYLPFGRTCGPVKERRRAAFAGDEGALVLGFKHVPPGPKLTGAEYQLLEALARQVAILLGNARLYRLATRDTLTGLACRRTGLDTLNAEIALASSNGQSTSCVFVDVDDFKLINDRYGHGAGDGVLVGIGESLCNSLRAEDLACRWGGEEFLVLLPNTDQAGALQVAEKLRQRIKGLSFHEELGPVTLSIGVSCYPAHADSAEALVQAADLAMYRAKQSGKDRVVGYSPQFARPESAQIADPARRAEPAAPWIGWTVNCAWFPALRLTPGTVTLGRSPSADLVLQNASVSRRHGNLVLDKENKLRYVDTSTNGALLNDEPIHGMSEVSSGDQLRVGPYLIEFRFDAAEGPKEIVPLTRNAKRTRFRPSTGGPPGIARRGAHPLSLNARSPLALRQCREDTTP